ncbi:MAG: hypothetical protein JW804_08670 [Sedimentisphaerales bacterium]|nr:hypothetical protein [Sedimentisphaerales bacterium]
MSNEIHIDYESGNTLYAVLRDSTGKVWYPAGQSFEDWGNNGHDADDYDLSLTDKDGNRYVGDFDNNIGKGRYTIQIFLQADSNPANTDELIAAGAIFWTGNSELTCDKIFANKAVQDKLTGKIEYYDDDSQTVILTHTPTDQQSTLTRTPS